MDFRDDLSFSVGSAIRKISMWQMPIQHHYNDESRYFCMIHKIKYFEAAALEPGVFLQDVVNDFLAEKGDKVIAVHPVMEKTLLVHYTEEF